MARLSTGADKSDEQKHGGERRCLYLRASVHPRLVVFEICDGKPEKPKRAIRN
jgi:hypothetical protein